MNMFTKKLNWLIMSMMLMVSGSAWAGEETIIFSEQGYENAEEVVAVEATNFSVTFDKGTNNNNAPKYYTTGAAVRAYGGNTFTVSSDYTIIKIALTFASGEGNNAITTDVGSTIPTPRNMVAQYGCSISTYMGTQVVTFNTAYAVVNDAIS